MKESTDRYYNIFSDRFWLGQIDLRPLGFMRAVFGAVLFWSVIDLVPVLMPFFADDGVAPRAALLGTMVRPNRVCLYDIAGPDWLLVALYVLTLAAILAFMVGWHSKLASIATFVLVCGIHERDLVVFDGADGVLRVLLFWMMFMPIGGRYSVDAILRAARKLPTITHGIAMPIRMGQFQIAWIYFNGVLYKWPGVEWHNGTALRIALGLDHLFARPFGSYFAHNRFLVMVGTRGTIAFELLFLPLVFLPIWKPKKGLLSALPPWLCQPTWKSVGIAGTTAMHLGIAFLMSVGNFSYIMISSYFLLFESEWIESIVQFLDRRRPWRAAVVAISRWGSRYIVESPMDRPSAPRLSEDLVGLIPGVVRRFVVWVSNALLLPGLMFLGVWFSLPDTTQIPPIVVRGHRYTPKFELAASKHLWPPLFHLIEELELWQRWNMFSPKPLDHDGYIMGRGELADGIVVDVLRGNRGNGGALLPPIMPGFFFSRWTKYISNIIGDQGKDSPAVMELARYVCRGWNIDPPHGRATLKAFKLYREERKVPLFGEKYDEWNEVMIWDHKCF